MHSLIGCVNFYLKKDDFGSISFALVVLANLIIKESNINVKIID